MILVPYPFPLRPELVVTLELPDDLTGDELDRLLTFLGTLRSAQTDGQAVVGPPVTMEEFGAYIDKDGTARIDGGEVRCLHPPDEPCELLDDGPEVGQ